jgi:hypothetical protein
MKNTSQYRTAGSVRGCSGFRFGRILRHLSRAHLFEKLAALNLPFGQIAAALNIVPAENDKKRVTRDDFERFLEQVEAWEL